MTTLIRREFVVNIPLKAAWHHLARVEQWPAWAHHIKHIELSPAGELLPTSTGLLQLRLGIQSTFHMAEFNLYRNWMWVGQFLWLTIHYDHRFEAQDAQRTKLIWIVEGEGVAISLCRRLFAAIYKKNLDKAIPRLIAQMNALPA